MIKMIIADDEFVIRKGLKTLFDWESLGIEIIAEAGDGEELLRLIEEEKPEIVISDICMPEKDGIEVLKAVNERNLPVKFILISGYQDFNYARDGLKYGAVDYILKPIDENVLKNAILRVTKAENSEAIEEGNSKKYSVLIIDGGTPNEMDKIQNFVSEFEPDVVKYNGYPCVIFEEGVHQDIKRRAQTVISRINNELGISAVGGLGKQYLGTSNIVLSYNDAKTCLDYSYFFDELRLFTSEDKKLFKKDNKVKFRDLLTSFTQEISRLNEEGAKEIFLEIAEYIKNESMGIQDAAIIQIYSVIDHIKNTLHADFVESIYDNQSILEFLKTGEKFSVVIRYVFEIISVLINHTKSDKKSSGEFEINKVRNYIEEHIAEDVSLEAVAKVVYMNMYYFSVYFKKHTGVNFKEYVTKIRMEKAMVYVKETDMKISEIGSMVGYSSHKHFSKTFKKYFGENVADVRRKLNEK